MRASTPGRNSQSTHPTVVNMGGGRLASAAGHARPPSVASVCYHTPAARALRLHQWARACLQAAAL
eukprot:scaffold2308_cov92-Isochrysis_galbana.AAC.1